MLLAQALAPPGQRGAIEGQLVAERLLAAEVLVVDPMQASEAWDIFPAALGEPQEDAT